MKAIVRDSLVPILSKIVTQYGFEFFCKSCGRGLFLSEILPRDHRGLCSDCYEREFQVKDVIKWTHKTQPMHFQNSFHHRITSYNVCYTKLLRRPRPGWSTGNKRSVAISKGENCFLHDLQKTAPFTELGAGETGWSIISGRQASFRESARITSYNVCYTKLLRGVRLPTFRMLCLFWFASHGN